MGRTITERIRASTAAQAALFGLLYLFGAELGHFFSFRIHDQALATFWPPTGFMIALLVMSPYRRWPIFMVAGGIANLVSNVQFHDRSMTVSLGFFVANGCQACLGAWLLRRFVGTPLTLSRVKEVLALACFAALLCSAVGAAGGAAVIKLADAKASYWASWQTWLIGDILGVMVFASVVFTWTAECPSFFRIDRPGRIVECIALFLGLTVVAEAVYGQFLPRALLVPIFLLPFFIWGAMRFGPAGTSAVILVSALIAVWNAAKGSGPYTLISGTPEEHMLRMQGTLGVASLSVLLLAAAVAERKLAVQRQKALIGELEKALTEIKTLRGLIPLCAWCKKIRDDQGFWQGLEDYLRLHTEAQFTHGICPDCLQKELDPKHPKGSVGEGS